MYDKIRKLLPVLSKTASFGYISEPKKADTEVSAAINLSAERLFNCFNYCLECFGSFIARSARTLRFSAMPLR